MSKSNEVARAELGFGDVIQFGKQIPGTNEIEWNPSLEIVRGPTSNDTTECLSTWTVYIDDENAPAIGTTGTTPTAYVRRFGNLTDKQIEPLLEHGMGHTKLARARGMGHIFGIYLSEQTREVYESSLHEVPEPSLEDLMHLIIQIKTNQELWHNQ